MSMWRRRVSIWRSLYIRIITCKGHTVCSSTTKHVNVNKVAQLFFFFFSFLACAKNVPFSSSTQLIFQLSTYIHWRMALSSSELLPVSTFYTFHNIRSRDPAHTTRNVFLVALVWIPALLTWKIDFFVNSRYVQRVLIKVLICLE